MAEKIFTLLSPLDSRHIDRIFAKVASEPLEIRGCEGFPNAEWKCKQLSLASPRRREKS